MTHAQTRADLIERLNCLYVHPQFIADHYADILTPRQIKQLYEIGDVAADAAERIAALEAFAVKYVAAWEAGTGTVYLIDEARAALKGTDQEDAA